MNDNHEPKLVKTCRSENVTLGIFLRFGDYGPFLEPAKPVYRYQDSEGDNKFSSYLRDRHCIHAAVCFQQAHEFIQQWKSNHLNRPAPDSPDDVEDQPDGESPDTTI